MIIMSDRLLYDTSCSWSTGQVVVPAIRSLSALACTRLLHAAAQVHGVQASRHGLQGGKHVVGFKR